MSSVLISNFLIKININIKYIVTKEKPYEQNQMFPDNISKGMSLIEVNLIEWWSWWVITVALLIVLIWTLKQGKNKN